VLSVFSKSKPKHEWLTRFFWPLPLLDQLLVDKLQPEWMCFQTHSLSSWPNWIWLFTLKPDFCVVYKTTSSNQARTEKNLFESMPSLATFCPRITYDDCTCRIWIANTFDCLFLRSWNRKFHLIFCATQNFYYDLNNWKIVCDLHITHYVWIANTCWNPSTQRVSCSDPVLLCRIREWHHTTVIIFEHNWT
jgi:hypothetical protein